MFSPFLLLLVLPTNPEAADRFAAAPLVAAQIDAVAEKHWQDNGVQPAALVDDAAFLRRLTVDLAGRIPTYREAVTFTTDPSPDKRSRAIRRLMQSPEYARHLGRVLDEMIQGQFAGEPEFLDYLRSAVAEHKPWDQLFREVLLGPWDTKERKRADRFLARRLLNLDDLTNDTARVFFGVNVSCAKCHDHPLVPDWTQDHYYGMASFFVRTHEASKGKPRNKAGLDIMEKTDGDVMFVTTKGERRTAKTMFLSSQVLDEPAPNDKKDRKPAAGPVSRREQLVRVALEEKTFFSRAIVNRLWAYFVGRGLVHPVDQMHSANPPSIPGLLEWLGDDLAAHGYDLDRLVAGLVSSQLYQRASSHGDATEDAGDKHFAQAALRPLTPQQYALSLVLATGDDAFDQASEPQARARRYRELEDQSVRLTKPQVLDRRTDQFQSSTTEALFLSNHPDVQRLTVPSGNNLAARLAALTDTQQLIETAIWTILSRPPEDEERVQLRQWVEARGSDRSKACGQLIWALVTSAEFRFNH